MTVFFDKILEDTVEFQLNELVFIAYIRKCFFIIRLPPEFLPVSGPYCHVGKQSNTTST